MENTTKMDKIDFAVRVVAVYTSTPLNVEFLRNELRNLRGYLH